MDQAPNQRFNDKREKILKATHTLFRRYGVKRTSVDDIAREAEIAKGTFYIYFDSKDAIIQELFERHIRTTDESCERALTRTGSPREVIVHFLDAASGVPFRSARSSPHFAELRTFAETEAVALDEAATRRKAMLTTKLREIGITHPDACEMLFVTALGLLNSENLEQEAFCARLGLMIDVLLAGFEKLGASSVSQGK